MMQSQEQKEAVNDLLALAGSVSVPAAEADLDYRDLQASIMDERYVELSSFRFECHIGSDNQRASEP